jgi:hypothetical protein
MPDFVIMDTRQQLAQLTKQLAINSTVEFVISPVDQFDEEVFS